MAPPGRHLAADGPSAASIQGGDRSYAVAAFLLLVPFLAPLLAALGFAARVPIGPLHLPLAVAVAALATLTIAEAEGLPRRDGLLAVGIGVVCLAAALAAGHVLLDFSYDGQAYHQSAIRQLVAGWNPVVRDLRPDETTHGLWLNHYVRAVELASAAVMASSGSLEAGKGLGMTLAVAATLFGAFALRGAGARRGPALAAAAIASANPIVLSQLATFYVDGQLALVFACALALGLSALRGYARTAPLLLGVALALLANVKFTATVYAVLLLAGYVVACARSGVRWRCRAAWATAAVAVTAAIAIGWQPLFINAARHGHLFYPVAGQSHVDGLSGQTPPFRYRDPWRRLVESTVSESNAARTTPSPKLPFVVRPGELAAMGHPDVRIGGFGPLFALAVLLCAIGLATLPWSGGSRSARAALLVAAGVLATALVNPGAWWARFVPQLWIATALGSVALAASRRVTRWLGVAALVVLGVDALLVATSVARHQVGTHLAAAQQARELARRHADIELPRGEMESLDLRLARAGLHARYVPGCSPTRPLVGTYALYCESSGP